MAEPSGRESELISETFANAYNALHGTRFLLSPTAPTDSMTDLLFVESSKDSLKVQLTRGGRPEERVSASRRRRKVHRRTLAASAQRARGAGICRLHAPPQGRGGPASRHVRPDQHVDRKMETRDLGIVRVEADHLRVAPRREPGGNRHG